MATLDVVTLAEAKPRLGGSVTKTTDDDEIQADITALSALFDQRFGAIVQRAIVGERVHPNRSCNDWANLWPVLDTPAPAADEGTVEVVDDFGMLAFSTYKAKTISYTAGRFANTAAVSEQFKGAFLITLRNWRAAGYVSPHIPPGPDYPTPRSSFPTFAMPNASAQMLHDFRRIQSGIA